MMYSGSGSHSIGENRRLRDDNRRKHFNKKEYTTKSDKTFNDEKFKIDIENNYFSTEFRKNSKIIRDILLIFSIAIFLILSLMIFGPKLYDSYKINHPNVRAEVAKAEIERQTRNYKNNDYFYLLSEGEDHLKSKNLKFSQRAFKGALKVYPKSKDAVFGLTKCLILQCKTDSTNCDEAKKYYDGLKASKTISSEKLVILAQML